jgi:type I restriction enzyme S subunit
MSELPLGWVEAQLSDLTSKVGSGATPRGGSEVYKLEGIPLIRSMNVRFDGFDSEGLVFLSDAQAKALDEVTVRAGDVLLNITGASIGRVTQAPSSMDGARVNQHVCIIRPKQGIDASFMSRYLSSPDVQSMIWSEQYGVTRQALTKGQILEFVIPLPPLPEQRRIVAKLEQVLARVDACRSQLAQVPTILKRYRQSVLAAACSGRLTEDWREEHPCLCDPLELMMHLKDRRSNDPRLTGRERTTVQAIYEDFPLNDPALSDNELPATWWCCRVGHIGMVSNGSTPSRKEPSYWNGDIPWVSSGEVRNNDITETRECITRTGYQNASVRMLPVGTVLLAMIGEGKTRGQTAILGIEATINQNIAAIVPEHEAISSDYLWLWLQHRYESNREEGSGSGPQALNCQRVRELPVNLPPLNEQHEIVRRVTALFALADGVEARYAEAKTHVDRLTQSILAKAFRGELVPQDPADDPADEPAAALLARIRAARGTDTVGRRGKRS